MSAEIGTLYIRNASDEDAPYSRVGDIAYHDSWDASVGKRCDDICLAFVRLGYIANVEHSIGAIVYTKDDLPEEEA